MARYMQQWLCLWLLVLCTPAMCSKRKGQHGDTRTAIQSFFDRLDGNQDGQLQQSELRQFVGNLGPTTGGKLDHAVQQVISKLDGADSGLDVSVLELDQYLHKILEGVKVWDWITHSLGLPMYAEAFRDNAITVLDFPMLVNDGGKLLETELMVTRVLHRQKILRAMQRLMLGLGVEPGPIMQLNCTSSSSSSWHNSSTAASSGPSSCASSQQRQEQLTVTRGGVQQPAAAAAAPGLGVVRCTWRPPSSPGEPPVHKYVLERFALARPGATWQTAAELDDHVTTRFNDVVQQPGAYQYRVAAWNLYGRTSHAFSDEVIVQAAAEAGGSTQTSAPVAAIGKQQQQQQRPLEQGQQAVIPASASKCSRLPLQQQLQQEQEQQQHVSFAVVPAGEHPSSQQGCATCAHDAVAASAAAAGGDVAGLCGHLGMADSSSGAVGELDGLVLHTPSSSAATDGSGCHNSCISSRGDSWQCMNEPCSAAAAVAVPCDNALAMPASCLTGTAPSGASAAGPTASHSVVWVIGQGGLAPVATSPAATPAAIVAQAQLLASMQAAAGADVPAAAAAGSQIDQQQYQLGTAHTAAATSTAPAAAAAAAGRPRGSWWAWAAAVVASHLGKWLWAAVNSLLLLVVPVCVRLLPVPVLARLAAALSQLLQLLPLRVQQALLQCGGSHGLTVAQQQAAEEHEGVGACSAVSAIASIAGPTAARAALKPCSTSTSTSSSSGGLSVGSIDAAGVPVAPAAAGFGAGSSTLASMGSVSPAVGAGSSTGLASGNSSQAAYQDSQQQQQQRQRQVLHSLNSGGLPALPSGLDSSAGELAGLLPVGSPVGGGVGTTPAAVQLPASASDGGAAAGALAQGLRGLSLRQERLPSAAGGSAGGAGGLLLHKSCSAVDLLHHQQGLPAGWVGSPRSSSSPGRPPADAGRPPPAAAPAAAAAAAQAGYTGMYGFGWGPAAPVAPPTGLQAGAGSGRTEGAAAAQAGMAGSAGDSGLDPCCVPDREQQLQLQQLGYPVPCKKRCAFPGCQQQFDLRHLRALMQRHYCGRCQQAFCLQHTAYSPHGPSGSCGAESRCVCVHCFYEFTPEYRMFLSSRNTLISRRSKSGPPGQGGHGSVTAKRSVKSSPVLHKPAAAGVAAGMPAGAAAGLAVAAALAAGCSDAACAAVGPLNSQDTGAAPSVADETPATATAGSAAAGSGDAEASSVTSTSSSVQADLLQQQEVEQEAKHANTAAAAAGLNSKMLWARAWIKTMAVVRFQQAGQQHHEHKLQQH